MRVYYAGNDRANHLASVCPANDPRARKVGESGEWRNADGAAKTFHIDFKAGMAEVPDHLGKYLCSIGLAKRTRLLGFA